MDGLLIILTLYDLYLLISLCMYHVCKQVMKFYKCTTTGTFYVFLIPYLINLNCIPLAKSFILIDTCLMPKSLFEHLTCYRKLLLDQLSLYFVWLKCLLAILEGYWLFTACFLAVCCSFWQSGLLDVDDSDDEEYAPSTSNERQNQ